VTQQQVNWKEVS